MSPTEATMHHVIIGNGVAGMEAAIALRKRDLESRISVISAEHDHFFSRTALMYILSGQLSVRDTEPYDRELYTRLRLERIRGRVTKLQAESKSLELESGQSVQYDSLLLAVGSKARPAPWKNAQGPGLHAFVTLQDLEKLDAEAKPGMAVAVIGGGLIGVEVSETLHLRGLKVHFIIREPWYFPVALDMEEAQVVAEHIRHHGVDVRTDCSVEEVIRDEKNQITGVKTGAGEVIPCQLVVAAIGVVPNTEFLKGSAVKLDPGGVIEADETLKTSAPEVWTAGDCALVTWIDGGRRPEQLWYTARDQGKLVAGNMLGDNLNYRRKAWYNSAKFFDLEYTTAGYIPVPLNRKNVPQNDPSPYTNWFQRVPGTTTTQRIILKGDEKEGRVVGFNCMGSRWDHQVFLRWISERRSLPWVLKHMNEARYDEEFMPEFAVYNPTITYLK